MTARRFPAAFASALLALLAVLQLTALSTWHGATLHDDSHIHASSVRHGHHETPSEDVDGTIHLAAHVLGQGINVPALLSSLVAIILQARVYGPAAAVMLSGRSPPSLLDPPRS